MQVLKYILTMTALWGLLVLCGCQSMLVASKELKEFTVFRPVDYNLPIEHTLPKKKGGREKIRFNFPEFPPPKMEQLGITKIPYAGPVKSAIGICTIHQHTYPVLFDTGNPFIANISVSHVRENQLPVYPNNPNEWGFGVAVIPQIQIGTLCLKNVAVDFDFEHSSTCLFGLPWLELKQSKEIGIPLSVIRQFSYIAFDNIENQMEISLADPFAPMSPDQWTSYPFEIRKGYLYLESTLGGLPVTLILDTGCEADLFLDKSCFDKMLTNHSESPKIKKLKKKGFAPHEGGTFSLASYLVSGLVFDRQSYNDVTFVGVVENNRHSRFLQKNQFDGMIGFPFFKNTVMVLDFEKNLMWVKKAKGSRFQE